MNRTIKRYRRLWVVFGGICVASIFVGDTHVVSYTLGNTVEQLVERVTAPVHTQETTTPLRRRGHPREELFIETTLPQK